VIVDTTKQCAYCRSPVVSGLRWVREKIYEPGLGAEPFPGQEGSCWEKHQMEVEIGRAFVNAT